MPLTSLLPPWLRQLLFRLVPSGTWERVRPVIHGETVWQRSAENRRLQRYADRHPAPSVRARPVRFGRAAVLGEVVESFDAERVRTENLRVLTECLAAVDGEWAVLDVGPSRRSLVVVRAGARERVLAALPGYRGPHVPYLRPRDRSGRPRPLAEADRVGRGPEALLFHRFLVSADGTLLESGSVGCEIEFWSPTETEVVDSGGDVLPIGTLMSPVKNRWVDHVRPEDWSVARLAVEFPVPALPTAGRAHVFDVTEPVDVVYTWVDGDDPEWQRRKAEALETSGEVLRHPTAVSDSRYASRDELRYSLRSLEMFAGWVRHVYLVTDRQVPPWLDTEHPRVTVVDHTDIFGDRGLLPTFNSHAIETQLHHIEGLSEHFLYLNDDVFFGRPVRPEAFFTGSGLSRFFPSTAKLDLGPAHPGEAPVMSAAKNNRALVEGRFGRVVSNKLKHVPHALRVSVLSDMEETFSEAYAATSRSRFRHPDDHSVVSALHHWYGYCTGRAVPGEIRYFYADINQPRTPGRLRHLLRNRDVDAFCLNDHDANGDASVVGRACAEDFLRSYFPVASSFERVVPEPTG